MIAIQQYTSRIIWLLLRTSSQKKQKAHAYFGRLVFSKFFGGKITPFWKEFRKIRKIRSASFFFKFFGGKIKNFEQGFGEQKIWQKINSRDFRTKIRSDLMSKIAQLVKRYEKLYIGIMLIIHNFALKKKPKVLNKRFFLLNEIKLCFKLNRMNNTKYLKSIQF